MGFERTYYENTLELINKIYCTQMQQMEKAADCLEQAIRQDGLIYVFGCGHSHMVSEELFYRAGGLVQVCPILDSAVMLHEGAAKSSKIERMSGLAGPLLERYEISSKDVLLIVSNSGINSFGIEMALEARQKGCCVVAISSSQYGGVASRHKSGKYLKDICDIYIDNCVGKGDACVKISEDGRYAGPLSSLSAFFIANLLILMTCERQINHGQIPKVYCSGNIDGTDGVNEKYILQYRSRIRHL